MSLPGNHRQSNFRTLWNTMMGEMFYSMVIVIRNIKNITYIMYNLFIALRGVAQKLPHQLRFSTKLLSYDASQH
ncbi:hypothetical protein NQ317_005445 [Molorchus minor]|uniref:Uncharacterized protein n=1 Tax=Molorchus minor TaxID=1323400 RepID=A0ABQ9JIK1_9CUCU|nr:hypothetical protein NQ317_005445 [Molorchus minor]